MSILHVVLWAFPNAEDAANLIKFAKDIPTQAKRDGKTYILGAEAGYTMGPFPGRPMRSQGKQFGRRIDA